MESSKQEVTAEKKTLNHNGIETGLGRRPNISTTRHKICAPVLQHVLVQHVKRAVTHYSTIPRRSTQTHQHLYGNTRQHMKPV